MASKTLLSSLYAFLFSLIQLVQFSAGQDAVKAAYWFPDSGLAASDINSTLFTHLFFAFANLDNQTYQLTIFSADSDAFAQFTQTVQLKNPSVKTLLSIGGGHSNKSDFALMARQPTSRKSFIDSSFKLARSNDFLGLDLDWQYPETTVDMDNLGTLLDEWRAAAATEAKNSGKPPLILTAAVYFSPTVDGLVYPVQYISRNLDWINVMAYDFYGSTWSNVTNSLAALYDPTGQVSGSYGIGAWTQAGMSAKKLVLGIPFYGYAWRLVDASNHSLLAPANGSASRSDDGSMTYQEIEDFIAQNNATTVYNETIVSNYCYAGTTWIGYDNTQSVSAKVLYTKQKGLLGNFAWHVGADNNWTLSQQFQALVEDRHGQNRRWMVITLPIIALVAVATLLVGSMMHLRRRAFGSKEKLHIDKMSESPNLQVFNFADIYKATNSFSIEAKLGEGGYGPVYKGKLLNGQEIAVKRLSQSSKQGLEEFENEVTLTAKLQHVNLVRLLGFCTGREEKMLIYEYMPNKSLDFYLFEPTKRILLDWEKWVHIIECITQGLLYLQEYSRLTIIHRDMKSSNILLDADMKPKISDFGIARSFQKDENEANTDRIVGTRGYVPPEYVEQGIYSRKYDVYSFGVLLLQIISGKKTACSYGSDRNLNLMEYVALLCVEEKWTKRPTMLEVSSMLRNETTVIPTPERPAFSIKGEGEAKIFTSQDEIISVDVATISQLVPR